MKKCKSCQSEIDDKATKCPHCQADQRNWFRRHPIITGFFALLLVGIVGTASSTGRKKTNDQELQITPQQEEQAESQSSTKQEPIKLNVREFSDDFDSNQVAAENKWNGKFIEFSAKISNITDSGISFYGVASKDFSMTQISCRIKDKEQLLSLKNGQTVTVRGIVGTQILGIIEINDCEVVE